jgi:C1A family cysteine protease
MKIISDIQSRATQLGIGMGWLKDLPDYRDFMYAAPPKAMKTFPPRKVVTDDKPKFLSAKTGQPWSQSSIGSCVAHGVGSLHLWVQMKQPRRDVIPSRLFIYYEARRYLNTLNSDSGSRIRDAMKVMNKLGVPNETKWPYDISKFTQPPPPIAYTNALKHQTLTYMRLMPTMSQLKGGLVEGFPFVFGFTCFSSLLSQEVLSTGDIPMPGPNEQDIGGHAILCIGYDDALQRFLLLNSWGADCGKNGIFSIPYSYVTDSDLSSDFWTLRSVEG